ncbi:hypothetical protein [Azotobacter salinestris]|uniref:hypothetical protein n=1 Tax=Azotobacter salinestris TaxID=69964 RepID=UPI001266A9D1|nr:hypothetical protein [Azotobacter salinestris]
MWHPCLLCFGIHQPDNSLNDAIDDQVLLGPGGRHIEQVQLVDPLLRGDFLVVEEVREIAMAFSDTFYFVIYTGVDRSTIKVIDLANSVAYERSDWLAVASNK